MRGCKAFPNEFLTLVKSNKNKNRKKPKGNEVHALSQLLTTPSFFTMFSLFLFCLFLGQYSAHPYRKTLVDVHTALRVTAIDYKTWVARASNLKKARNDKYNSSCKKTKIKKQKQKKTKQTNKKAHTEEMVNFLRTYCFLGQINLVILILYARAWNHPPTSTTVYLS